MSLRSVQLVAAAMTNPGQEMTVEALAEATNLHPSTIGAILSSQQYERVVSNTARRICEGLLVRALQSSVEIAEHPDVKPETKLTAVRTYCTALKTLINIAPQEASKNKSRELDEFISKMDGVDVLDALEAAGKIKRPDVTDEDLRSHGNTD